VVPRHIPTLSAQQNSRSGRDVDEFLAPSSLPLGPRFQPNSRPVRCTHWMGFLAKAIVVRMGEWESITHFCLPSSGEREGGGHPIGLYVLDPLYHPRYVIAILCMHQHCQQ